MGTVFIDLPEYQVRGHAIACGKEEAAREGGLKPEVIANTIVTGAGLGAIAVGVD